MKRTKRIKLAITLLFYGCYAFSQSDQIDTLTFSALNKTKVQFFLDDTYVFGGFNMAGIHYSSKFRDLKYEPGFVVGIEQYFPLSGKVFLSTGINISQRNFSFLQSTKDIHIRNTYIDFPVSAAFELPVLKRLDFRLLIGGNMGVRTNSNISGDDSTVIDANPDLFAYNINHFHKLDFGWTFGLSAEYKNVIFRFRSYSGLVKLDNKDQGMLSAFNFEIGYFLFRNLNKKQ